jgi:hypothetical protein
VQGGSTPDSLDKFFGQAELLGDESGGAPDTLRVFSGLVVAVLGRDRQALDDLQVCFLELARAGAHPLFERGVLAAQLALQEARQQEIADAQDGLGRIERLVQEVARAHRERASSRLGRRIGRENKDGQPFRPGRLSFEPGQDLEAVRGRHLQVEQDNVRVVLGAEGEGVGRLGRAQDVGEARGGEQTLE